MPFSYVLEIPEVELQEKINAFLPITQKRFSIQVALSDAVLSFTGVANELIIEAHVEVSIPSGLKAEGQALFKGVLDYDADQGAFYFKRLQIQSLHVKFLPQLFFASTKSLITFALSKVLDRYPVFKFSEKNKQHKLAKSSIKHLKIEDKVLKVTLGM